MVFLLAVMTLKRKIGARVIFASEVGVGAGL